MVVSGRKQYLAKGFSVSKMTSSGLLAVFFGSDGSFSWSADSLSLAFFMRSTLSFCVFFPWQLEQSACALVSMSSSPPFSRAKM